MDHPGQGLDEQEIAGATSVDDPGASQGRQLGRRAFQGVGTGVHGKCDDLGQGHGGVAVDRIAEPVGHGPGHRQDGAFLGLGDGPPGQPVGAG